MLGATQHPVEGREGVEQLRLGGIGLDIGRKPTDSVIVADHDLEAPPAIVERACELRLELGCSEALAEDREGMELAAGDI